MTEEKKKKSTLSWGEPPHFCSVLETGHWSGWELHGPQALCWWHDLLQFTDTIHIFSGICSRNRFNNSSFYRFLDKSFSNSFAFFRVEKSMEIFEINLSKLIKFRMISK